MSGGQDEHIQGLQVYLVGGAVRDALLGALNVDDAKKTGQSTEQALLKVSDRDWVVIGASPEQMRARGFVSVGGDFPVFLHPITKEEYALGRTERKLMKGYQGFETYAGQDVTLEQDLKRRDLTVNAIAQSLDGKIIDPFHGQQDLQRRQFRHVSGAFLEDPVRILRLGRFMARFQGFSVAPETLKLCQIMVANGEVDALVPERVWKEIARALMAIKPSRMFDLLANIQALAIILPGLLWNADVSQAIDQASQQHLSLEQRYALLCVQSPDCIALSRHLKVPKICLDYAKLLMTVAHSQASIRIKELSAEDILFLIERLDGLRKADRFLDIIQTYCLLKKEAEASCLNCLSQWRRVLHVALSVDAGAIAKELGSNIAELKERIRAARLQAILHDLQAIDHEATKISLAAKL